MFGWVLGATNVPNNDMVHTRSLAARQVTRWHSLRSCHRVTWRAVRLRVWTMSLFVTFVSLLTVFCIIYAWCGAGVSGNEGEWLAGGGERVSASREKFFFGFFWGLVHFVGKKWKKCKKFHEQKWSGTSKTSGKVVGRMTKKFLGLSHFFRIFEKK